MTGRTPDEWETHQGYKSVRLMSGRRIRHTPGRTPDEWETHQAYMRVFADLVGVRMW